MWCSTFSAFRYLIQHAASYHVCSGGGSSGSRASSRMEELTPEEHHYRSPNHAERMMAKIEAYQSKELLWDVVLIAEQTQIRAHRLVLSAASDYFAAMFTSDVREATQKEVVMQNVDPQALVALVDYIYTGETAVFVLGVWSD